MIPGIIVAQHVVAPPSGVSDPYWANVVALLHFDDTPGAGTFVDAKGHVFTSSGTATTSTAQQKFGSASLLLNGTNEYVASASSTDWEMAGGNFTIECWARPSVAVTTRMEIIDRWNAFGFGLQIMDTGFLRGFCQGTTGGLVLCGPGATTVTHNVWHHIAFVRDGTTLRLFLDGVSQGTAVFTGTIDAITDTLDIGYDNGGTARYFRGNIDEVRITKGVARYTADFTPPTSPFPSA